MRYAAPHPGVHLELHTSNLLRACAFYTRMFGWHAETVHYGAASYVTLDLGDGIQGGVVEHPDDRALWIPYVEVPDVATAVESAQILGASAVLDPREGPSGWRAIIAVPSGATVALWQPKDV